MLKLLALLLVLSTTAFAADGNGIERGSYRGENPAAKIPKEILDMIELKMLQQCDTSSLSVIRVESVEIEKIGIDQYDADTSYTVVLWAPGNEENVREHIFVKVVDATASLGYSSYNPISIYVSSRDIKCE